MTLSEITWQICPPVASPGALQSENYPVSSGFKIKILPGKTQHLTSTSEKTTCPRNRFCWSRGSCLPFCARQSCKGRAELAWQPARLLLPVGWLPPQPPRMVPPLHGGLAAHPLPRPLGSPGWSHPPGSSPAWRSPPTRQDFLTMPASGSIHREDL